MNLAVNSVMTTTATNQKKPKSLPRNWPKSTEADLIERPNRIVQIGNVNLIVLMILLIMMSIMIMILSIDKMIC